MTEFPYQKFLTLVSFDQSTQSMIHEVERLEKEINDFQNEIFRHEDSLELNKQSVTACKKNVDQKELEMKDLDAKIKAKKALFDRIVNQREFKSAQQELEALKISQFQKEETLLEAWNTLESTSRGYLDLKVRLEKRISELESIIDSLVAQKKELIKTIQKRDQERNELLSGIPSEWLEKYSAMKRSVSNPAVPVINNACSACFYSVTQQDSARLKKHALLQCKECYRFLYME